MLVGLGSVQVCVLQVLRMGSVFPVADVQGELTFEHDFAKDCEILLICFAASKLPGSLHRL